MTFTADQNALLAKPLTSGNVKKNPRGYSYVEGWHVIAEANRIFGFDGWARQTVEIKCVSERERQIGKTDTKPGYPGWGVSYIAKVRIAVGDVIREGCGAGHGIDRDLGNAHESAIKEAETDAMKRAFMTFGNPFGLALYDKEQAGVADEPSAKELLVIKSKQTIAEAADPAKLAEWWNSEAEKAARRFVGMDQSEANALKEILMDRIKALKPPANMLKAG
jgi:hypothetical protein